MTRLTLATITTVTAVLLASAGPAAAIDCKLIRCDLFAIKQKLLVVPLAEKPPTKRPDPVEKWNKSISFETSIPSVAKRDIIQVPQTQMTLRH